MVSPLCYDVEVTFWRFMTAEYAQCRRTLGNERIRRGTKHSTGPDYLKSKKCTMYLLGQRNLDSSRTSTTSSHLNQGHVRPLYYYHKRILRGCYAQPEPRTYLHRRTRERLDFKSYRRTEHLRERTVFSILVQASACCTSSCMAYGLPLYLQPAVSSKTAISKYEQVLVKLSLRTQSESLLSPLPVHARTWKFSLTSTLDFHASSCI
jgi:hypothetical protein